MLTPRKTVQVVTWPDPLLQERLEDVGFFYDQGCKTWIRYCDPDEIQGMGEWLAKHQLTFRIAEAAGRGETKKHPRLADNLILTDGGGPDACALCGAQHVPCRQWIEGDDTDATDYPGAARFYMCGQCVQLRMTPHPRLYAPVEDQL